MFRQTKLILLALAILSGCSSQNTVETTTDSAADTTAEPASESSSSEENAIQKYIKQTGIMDHIDKAIDAYQKFADYQDDGDYTASDMYYDEAQYNLEQILTLPEALKEVRPFQIIMQDCAQYLSDAMDEFIKLRDLPYEQAKEAKEEGDRLYDLCVEKLKEADEWVKAYNAGEPYEVESDSEFYDEIKAAYDQYVKTNSKQEAAFFNLEFQATLLDQRMSEEPIIESELTSTIDLIISANNTFTQEKDYDSLMDEYVQWQLKAAQSWLLEAKAALLALEKAAAEYEMLTPSSFTQARDYFSQSKEYTDKLEAFRKKYND